MAPAEVDQTIPARFRQVVRAHPDCLAAQDVSRRLTYRELDGMSNAICTAILARSKGGREPVVLLFQQGIPSVVATLGALAAGRPYVPLDPSDPSAHLAKVADHVGARLILTDGEGAPAAEALRGRDRQVLLLEDEVTGPVEPTPHDLSPDSVACVYFTSGSTGSPKGVIDSHRNVLHNAMRYTATLGIGPGDRLSLIQSPSFSAVVSSTFAALLNGAALFPMRIHEGRVDSLAAAVREQAITVYHSVPSIFRSLVAVDGGVFPRVRVVRLEGDRAASSDVALHRRHFPSWSILANGLGATETGLSRQLRIAAGDTVSEGILPVGYPVPDMEVHVVAAAGHPSPVGEAGEIVVRSRHLALGYWGRADLTEAAFSPDAADPGLRIYRTGDLGRLRSDGCLEFLGRRDGQLKVGGRRVETAEIEGHLLALPGVVEAAVTTYPGRRGEGRLAAHLVVDDDDMDHQAIRKTLVERLPADMVPTSISFVASLPLTANGKVDRGALSPAREAAAVRPRNAVETALIEVWESVLERRDLGVDDDFFELGGDSLALAELLAAVEERIGRSLEPSALVRAPTIARLAADLHDDAAGGTPAGGIVPLQPRGGGTPLVLVHGLDFNTDTYAWLVRRLGAARPVWGLQTGDGGWGSIDDLARSHVGALRAARPDPPYLLAGFCSGAIVALEVARRLRAEGSEVSLVALIGVGAIDFPTLVSPTAAARYREGRSPLRRARRHLVRTRDLDPAACAALLRRAIPAVSRRIRASAGRQRARGGDPARRALALHAPDPLPGAVRLYLSAEATALYSDDPASDWAGLADRLTRGGAAGGERRPAPRADGR